MSDFDLQAVDGLTLPDAERALLRPDEVVPDAQDIGHRLPRFFYSVPSWPEARECRVAPHFKLSELMMVDCREADRLLQSFPHYVPCAVVVLARYLEDLRREADATVFVSANGGYRSPAHQWSKPITLHCWGTAADIYRVGDTYLNDEKSIARYAALAESLGPLVFVQPYTAGDDHLHLDLGYLGLAPREGARPNECLDEKREA